MVAPDSEPPTTMAGWDSGRVHTVAMGRGETEMENTEDASTMPCPASSGKTGRSSVHSVPQVINTKEVLRLSPKLPC